MRPPHIRFSQRESKGLRPMQYIFDSHTIRIPRSKELAKWKYVIDWSVDEFSHEFIHCWLCNHITWRDLPKGLKVADPAAYASNSLDRLREPHWEHSPDRAGMHFDAVLLELFDYTNWYELLSED